MDKIPLLKRRYKTLNKIEVSEHALLHNYRYLSSLSKEISVAPVLKSNAYGHGLQLISKMLDRVGAPFFCVDSLYEAYELYKNNIKTPILIMGYTHPENLIVKKLPFSFAVYDKETLAVLHKYQPQAGIHLFIDTGMHREGIPLSELSEFLSYCKGFTDLKIEGVMSHFGASDQFNNLLTIKQLENFLTAQKILEQAGIKPRWVHIGNSAACLLPKQFKGKIGNMARVGVAIYGIGGEVDDNHLQPVLKVQTTIAQIKKARKGEKIGYDFTHTAKKDMTIGILCYGYYDGMDRGLSNKGLVLIDGVICPIVGRVSMNITTVDISNISNPQVGQQAIIYSNNSSDKNSIQNVAHLAGAIQRDLLVHLAESTKRIKVR
jgi:alanine racemase